MSASVAGGSGSNNSTAVHPAPDIAPIPKKTSTTGGGGGGGSSTSTTSSAMPPNGGPASNEAHQYVGPYRLEKTLGKGQTGRIFFDDNPHIFFFKKVEYQA